MARARSEFGRRLRRLVSETGMTDVDFADHIGVNISTLKAWMRGDTHPGGYRRLMEMRERTGQPWWRLAEFIPEKLWTMRRAFGCEWEDILGG